MGTCFYCGQSAGLFSSKHKLCEEKFNEAKENIISLSFNYLTQHDVSTQHDILKSINEIAKTNFVDNTIKKNLLITGFENAIDKYLDDSLLSVEEESRIAKFIPLFKLEQIDLNKNGYYNKVVQASILRNLLDGVISADRIIIDGTSPFNFFQDEKLIWYYNNVNYYQVRNQSKYGGGSSGVSVKIMSGVYYRIGQFRGNAVQTADLTYISNGILAFTDQNIYFSSNIKSLRISYKKLLTVNPYSDAIGFQEDKVSAKPIAFSNIDGWFIYNIVTNLAKR